MRYCRPEHHVSRADDLDLALIRIGPWRRTEGTHKRKPHASRVVWIGGDSDNVSIQNDDLPLVKITRGERCTKSQAVRLILFGHGRNVSSRDGAFTKTHQLCASRHASSRTYTCSSIQ